MFCVLPPLTYNPYKKSTDDTTIDGTNNSNNSSQSWMCGSCTKQNQINQIKGIMNTSNILNGNSEKCEIMARLSVFDSFLFLLEEEQGEKDGIDDNADATSVTSTPTKKRSLPSSFTANSPSYMEKSHAKQVRSNESNNSQVNGTTTKTAKEILSPILTSIIQTSSSSHPNNINSNNKVALKLSDYIYDKNNDDDDYYDDTYENITYTKTSSSLSRELSSQLSSTPGCIDEKNELSSRLSVFDDFLFLLDGDTAKASSSHNGSNLLEEDQDA
mmetsp:Transcript_61485/g.91392  ORF Transcript_61485/g.91392 Transcript_61485/m.91392 type:complete len:272 (+) Transcript_61485:328-1143(+)